MRVPNFSVVRRFLSPVARFAAGALALGFGLQARVALGQTIDEFGAVRGDADTNRTTPQDINVELRFGPYQPALPNVTGDIPSFGDELGRNNRVLLGFEADWQALRIPKILNVGPGAGIGYTRLSNWRYGTSNAIGYSATLKFMPQWLWAVMREDVLQQR